MPVQLDSKILEDNVQFWEERYVKKAIQWHIEEVNPILVKHLPKMLELFPGPVGSSKRFFVPLCGMTKDIPYLISLGHTVFGVECVKSAIDRLDDENGYNFKYDEDKLLYYTEDHKVQIYAGDLFKCPIESFGSFDCIWDRGSFIAMDYPLREAYIAMMQRAVQPKTSHKFAYLLLTVRYDKEVFKGPPKCVDKADMEKYYEPWTKIEEVEKYIAPEDSSMRKVSGPIKGDFFEIAFLITNKQ